MSDDLKVLKSRIFKNNHVEKLLEELGCDEIRYEQRGSLIVVPHPDGWNKRSVQIKMNETLNAAIRNEGIEGDIYSVVGFFLYRCKSFEDVKSMIYQIKQWIINVLEYDDFAFNDFSFQKSKVDYNWWLRPIQKARGMELEVTNNTPLNIDILLQFKQYPWLRWIKEGIDYHTQREFLIGFDLNSERITIPIHNKTGEIIGIKGRYVGEDKTIQEDKKYSYLYPCSKSIELFNLHRAIPYITEAKECIVVEAAKTVMLLWSMGFKNVVSIEGDKLSPVQAKLLKELGIDIELVFAWDKDKSVEYIQSQTKQIKNRTMGYLYDEYNLFADQKASPADNGRETWLKLYTNKNKIL